MFGIAKTTPAREGRKVLPVMFIASAVALVMPTGNAAASGKSLGGVQWKVFKPPASDAPLLNPGMGIYIMVGPKTQLPPNSWIRKVCAIAYTRCDWADLEPQPGQYKFDAFFGPMIKHFVKELGWRIAFRVMCENMHSRKKYVTPKWVFDAGVPGVKHVGKYVPEQIDPVFWNDKYLDLHCRFIRALGAWVEKQKGIEFVDIGSIGEWGEMHFGLHIPGRWTRSQLSEAGFSEYKLFLAYRRIIDTFADAFPHSRVFLNVGSYENIDDYAAMRGLHFRQDGLGLHGASAGVDKWLYPEYAKRGVQCNLELLTGLSGMKARGWDPREVIRVGLKAPVSYMNMNFGAPNMFTNPPPEVKQAILEAARRIGYRFRLTEVKVPAAVGSYPTMPSVVPIQQTWVNEGTAPCYESLAFEWTIDDPGGKIVAQERTFPSIPTTKWFPGTKITQGCVLRLPPGLAPGNYRLCVRMFLPERSNTRYFLAMEGGDGQGKYEVGQISVVRKQKPPQQSILLDFEQPDSLKDVGLPKGMKKELATGEGLQGGNALRVFGATQKTWAYAILKRVKLVPGARYKLEGWLLVRSLKGYHRGPYLKVGINDTSDNWIVNMNTGKYDLRRKGQWQKFETEFDCPPEGVIGTIAIERGELDSRIEADILVDRVKLTLLAGP